MEYKCKNKKLKKYVKKAVRMAEKAVSFDYSLKFILKKHDFMKSEKSYYTGLYFKKDDKIYIRPGFLKNADEKAILMTILHEIGHSVHWHYFKYKAQHLPRKKHNSPYLYCNSSQKESFAECFADYVYALEEKKTKKIEKSKRLSKMRKLLKPYLQNNNIPMPSDALKSQFNEAGFFHGLMDETTPPE